MADPRKAARDPEWEEFHAACARGRRRGRLRGMFAGLPVDEQYDAVRWLLDELPALADVLQEAVWDFEAVREAQPLRLVKG